MEGMNLAHLKKLLYKHGINQVDLARILRRDKSVVTNLFQGKRQLKADEAALIAKHIGVTVADVMGLREKTDKGFAEQPKPTLIPFEANPSVKKRSNPKIVKREGRYFLNDSETSASPRLFALEVRDNSLNLSGVLEGDIIIAEMDRSFKSQQLVVVQHYNAKGAQTIIRRYQQPFLMPHSTSDKFKPLSAETDDVRIVAPVLKLIRTF